MDRPHQQAAPQEREMVFCHECENEWYRDEHGLTCPECGSDFTEIIEEEHDPRGDIYNMDDSDMNDGHDDDDDSDDHNPWRNIPDPDEGNVNEFRWQSTGPGRFTLHGTFYHTIGNPRARDNSGQDPQRPQDGVTQNFMTMIQGILGNAQAIQRDPNQDQGHPFATGQENDGHTRTIHGGRPGHRYTYTTTTRLFPRDGNNPMRTEPLDDLNAILGAMFGPQAFGQMPGRQGQQANQQPDQQQEGGGQLPPFNPLAALFGHFLNPGGIHGDVVYSQEALDRVISQLMEQNATGNAPGPATAEAISSLPKRKITISDLGSDGKAECSICMDEVQVGEDVTVLPCTHWFHGQCVSMWLGEHDTCPHCRQGIMDKVSMAENAQEGNGGGNSTSAPTGTAPSSLHSHSYPPSPNPMNHNPQLPGQFFSTSSTPPAGPPPYNPLDARSQSQPRPEPSRSRSDNGGQNDTIAGQIRRRLFGGGSNGSRN